MNAGKISLPILASVLLTLGMHAPLHAQSQVQPDQDGCVIGVDCATNSAAAPDDAPDNDPWSDVDPARSKDFVTVAIADSLGEERAAVEMIVRANPNMRLAENPAESEFMIARYPDFPDTLILVPSSIYQSQASRNEADRENEPEESDAAASFFARFDGEGAIRQLPPIIGQLDDNTLASGLNAEIQKTLWSRRFLAGPIPRQTSEVTTEIFGPKEAICSGTGDAKKCEYPYWAVVRNFGREPAYVALMRIDRSFPTTDNLVRLKDDSQLRLEPGESKMFKDDDFVDVPDAHGRHIVTIASKDPVDLSFFDAREGALPQLSETWAVMATTVPQYRHSVYVGGGFTVTKLATPWQVQLYSTDSSAPSLLAAGKINWQLHEKTHRCGGSLIEPYVVLTAAHCVANAPFATPDKRQTVFKFRRVKVGTKDLTRGGTTYAIDAVIVKKGYLPGGNHHDIALLRLKQDASTVARFAALRQPITLASRAPAPNNIVSAFGWGVMQEAAGRNTRISSTGAPQRNPAELQMGDLQVLDQNMCKKRAGYGHVTNLMLCAVTPTNSAAARQGRHVFTCLGDSGGPITRSENGRMVQVGVVSWAVGCGVNDNPSVSANVAAYWKWINDNKDKFETGKSIER